MSYICIANAEGILGHNPLVSLQMIDDLELHDAIFWFPQSIADTLSHQPASRSVGLAAASISNSIFSQFDHPDTSNALAPVHTSLLSYSASDKDVRRRLILAAAMTPFKGITYPEKKKTVPAVEGLVRVGLKVHCSPENPPIDSSLTQTFAF